MGLIAKVKQMLGIGTVSVKVSGPVSFHVDDASIKGKIIITGKSDQVIEYVDLEFRENYSVGTGDNKSTKQLSLGKIKFTGFTIKKDEIKALEFDLPFTYKKSQ